MPNFEGQVIAIRRISNAIDTEITQLLARTEPVKPGTAAHADLNRKIDQWSRQITAMQKSVKSQDSLLDVSHKSVMSKSGNYDAKQSYTSKKGNMDRLRRDLKALLKRIPDLVTAAKKPESEEAVLMKGLESAIKALTEKGEGLELTAQQSQTITTQVSKASGPLGPIEGYNPNAPIGMLTLVLVFFAAAKKVMGRGKA